jgi:hypothetical protein
VHPTRPPARRPRNYAPAQALPGAEGQGAEGSVRGEGAEPSRRGDRSPAAEPGGGDSP